MSRQSFGWRGAFAKAAAAMLAVTVLAACVTRPVYKPRGYGDSVGYTDFQVMPTRYRVTFTGNNATRSEEVESYLLRRAAEVTLANGYSHFAFETVVGPRRGDAREASTDPYWFPDIGIGLGSYAPGDTGYGYSDLRPIRSFSAYAEIVTLKPDEAAGNPRAIDAQDALQRIATPDAPATSTSTTPPRG